MKHLHSSDGESIDKQLEVETLNKSLEHQILKPSPTRTPEYEENGGVKLEENNGN